MDTPENKARNSSDSFDENKKIVIRLEEIASQVKYGNVIVDFTISRGKVAKAVIVEKKEVVLFG